MSSARHYDQDKDSTLYIGNLDERITDAIVWEFMLQAGPVVNVHLPKDRVTQSHQGYGFVEFASEEDAEYAAKIMNQIRLWGKPVRVNKASADRRGGPGQEGRGPGESQSVGAELFVGSLDSAVDEKVLYDTFHRFGPLLAPPKIARDERNLSKGYGFISYADFGASDEAIEQMHGKFLMNKEITVQYAFKKDGKGERHGDPAERALAAQAKKHGVSVTIPAMPASLVMPNAPSAPAAMNGYGGAPPVRAPQPPPSYNYAPYAQQPGYNPQQQPPYNPYQPIYTPQPGHNYGYQGGPPTGMPMPNGSAPPPAPNRVYNQSPLQAPSPAAGLPPRPPPSMGGYGGPMNAPGMQQNFQGGPPPGFAPPPQPGSFAGPPSGFPPQFAGPPGPPQGGPPPGFAPPPGFMPQPPHQGFRPPPGQQPGHHAS